MVSKDKPGKPEVKAAAQRTPEREQHQHRDPDRDHHHHDDHTHRALKEILERLDKLDHHNQHVTKELAAMKANLKNLISLAEKAIVLLGSSTADDAQVADVSTRLQAAIAAAGDTTGTDAVVLGSLGSFTGTPPTFVLSLSTATNPDPTKAFPVGSSFAARVPGSPTIMPGSFTVTAVDPIADTVTVTATPGWTPAAGLELGLQGVLV